MKFFICLIVLLGITQTRSFKDTKSILAQMESSQFGQGMLSLLQANQFAGNPLEEVTSVLNLVVEKNNEEQDAADKKNSTDQATCDENIRGYITTINNLKKSIDGLETLIEENEGILKLAQSTLSQAKADYAEVLGEIRDGTENREQEHAAWKARDDQANIDIVTLEEGVRLIQHMLHGVSFTEISSRYNKVLAQLGSSTQKTLYRPLISQLTQLSSQLNFDNVQKVLDLLNSMRKNLVDERARDLGQEEQQQHDWEVLLAQLTHQKKQLEAKIAKNEKIIEVTTELLKNSRVSLANAQASLENNQSLLAKQQDWCEKESSRYIAETDERERELEVLDKLLEHIEEKSQAVKGYLEERTANAPQ